MDKAFPAEEFGRPNFSVGVAEALCAQRDRLELVSREQPWTVAEARALVTSRKPPRTTNVKTETAPALGKPQPPAEECPDEAEPETPEEWAVFRAAGAGD